MKAGDLSWNWLRRTAAATRWSLVARLRAKPSPAAGLAADEFCRAYWHPLYAYLRSRGCTEADAQDHVQSFMLRLFEENWLARADAAKGRLRHFLLTLLARHVQDQRLRDEAFKRGGGAPHLPLDCAVSEQAYARDAQGAATPEESFRRALAVRLVDEGVKALRVRYQELGKLAVFDALLPALEGPLPEHTYAALAEPLGMQPAALRMAALRLRERFRHCVVMAASAVLLLPPGPALERELRDIFAGPPSGPPRV